MPESHWAHRLPQANLRAGEWASCKQGQDLPARHGRRGRSPGGQGHTHRLSHRQCPLCKMGFCGHQIRWCTLGACPEPGSRAPDSVCLMAHWVLGAGRHGAAEGLAGQQGRKTQAAPFTQGSREAVPLTSGRTASPGQSQELGGWRETWARREGQLSAPSLGPPTPTATRRFREGAQTSFQETGLPVDPPAVP